MLQEIDIVDYDSPVMKARSSHHSRLVEIPNGTIVGHWILDEATEREDRGFEYAGMGETVRIEAGSYPIVRDYSVRPWLFHCKMPAVVVSDWFWNRIGAHGNMSRDRHVGESRVKHHRFYGYEIANAAAEGASMGRIVLADGFTYSAMKRVRQYPHSHLCTRYSDNGNLVPVWEEWPERSYMSYSLEVY